MTFEETEAENRMLRKALSDALSVLDMIVADEESDGHRNSGPAQLARSGRRDVATALEKTRVEVFVPPMWLHNRAKLVSKDERGEPGDPSRPYILSRIRLRETAEDSTCTVTDVEAPDVIVWADGERPNLRKHREVSLAYVIKRFDPVSVALEAQVDFLIEVSNEDKS